MSIYSRKEKFVLFLLFLMVAVCVFGSRIYRLYSPHGIEVAESKVLLLYERTSLADLSRELDNIGVVTDPSELIWAGETLGWRSFRPGRYELAHNQSYGAFLSKLARGLQDPARVTVLPGSDIGRFSRHLSRQMRPDSSEFSVVFSDSSEIAIEAGLTGEQLFSRMMPNSYDFYWTSTAENTVRRLLREFERAAGQLAEEIEAHDLTLDDIVILASIVELEARHDDEKAKISGLYLNRLSRNMMLQADPTVLYALGERRRLLFEDYQVDHPYNTYQIPGLPPGPITNPSLSTIRSVLRPEEHEYLFMVATPEGSHRFSRTFEEHRQASEEWRRWLREQYRIRDEREQEEGGG